MDLWAWIGGIPSTVSSVTTAGGAFATFFILLARRIIILRGQHVEIVTALQKSHDATIAALKEGYAETMANLKAGHTELTDRLKAELATSQQSAKALGEAYEKQRTRSDEMQSKIVNEIVPLLGVNVKLLTSFADVKGGDPQ